MAKKKVKTIECKTDWSSLFTTLFVTAVILFTGWYYFIPSDPKYDVGTCLLSRDFQFLKVRDISHSNYLMEQLTISTMFNDGWYLYQPADFMAVWRSKHIVESAYTVIPCQSNPW